MFPLPISSYIIAGLTVLLGLTGWYGYHEHTAYVTFEARVSQEAADQKAQVQKEKDEAKQITDNTIAGYDAALKRLRNSGASGVRPATPAAGGANDSPCY